MPAATPSGWRIEYESMPREICAEHLALEQLPDPAGELDHLEAALHLAARVVELLPCSRVMMRARSSRWRSTSSRNRNSTRRAAADRGRAPLRRRRCGGADDLPDLAGIGERDARDDLAGRGVGDFGDGGGDGIHGRTRLRRAPSHIAGLGATEVRVQRRGGVPAVVVDLRRPAEEAELVLVQRPQPRDAVGVGVEREVDPDGEHAAADRAAVAAAAGSGQGQAVGGAQPMRLWLTQRWWSRRLTPRRLATLRSRSGRLRAEGAQRGLGEERGPRLQISSPDAVWAWGRTRRPYRENGAMPWRIPLWILAALLLTAPTAGARSLVDRGGVAGAKRWAAGREGQVAFAVVDERGRVRGYRAAEPFPSASLSKAMLLVAALRAARGRDLRRGEPWHLRSMVALSDNDAAWWVLRRIGGQPAMLEVARAARMRQFVEVGWWSDEEVAAADQARFFARVDRLVPRERRDYARELLSSVIVYQRWGIPTAVHVDGTRVFLKGGWRKDVVHQGALIERGRHRVALAVLTEDSASQPYARATIGDRRARAARAAAAVRALALQAGGSRGRSWLTSPRSPASSSALSAAPAAAARSSSAAATRCVLDVCTGTADRLGRVPWTPDTLGLSFSTTKGIASTVIHRLADRGALDYDEPVATYWPEFAAGGKERVTVRDVLTHRAGLSSVRAVAARAEDLLDHIGMEERLAARAVHAPTTRSAYHAITYGWLVAGIARRVSGGRGLAELVRRRSRSRLDAPALHIGVRDAARDSSPSRWLRGSARSPRGAGLLARCGHAREGRARAIEALVVPGFHRLFEGPEPPIWNTEMPAVNGAFSAEALARMYGALANAGRDDGTRLLSPEATEALGRVQVRTRDAVLGMPMRWRLGYHQAFGTGRDARKAFGHYGYGGSGGWADPDLGAVAGLRHEPNRLGDTPLGDLNLYRLTGLVRQAAAQSAPASPAAGRAA